MENYKENIAQTRKGCLGSSDGSMLAQISSLGYIPQSSYQRLAVVKGLIPQKEIPKTDAIRTGDEIEMAIYEHLKLQDNRYESNPCLVSNKYSTANCRLIAHPDLLLKDEEKKIIFVYEVKATKYSFEQTRQTYAAQLYIEEILAKELATKLGRGWRVRLSLVHYNTNGLDLSNGVEFDVSRLTVKPVRMVSAQFNIQRAMNLVNDFLETFTEYYEGEDVDADLLPEPVRNELTEMATALEEIKARETKIEEFKSKLYDFMQKHNVKSIKNDYFAISVVPPSESKTFDSKKYIEDLKAKYPRKSQKIIKEYTKTTKRKGYCKIKVYSE
jgi:hypothetical protein